MFGGDTGQFDFLGEVYSLKNLATFRIDCRKNQYVVRGRADVDP